MRKLNEQEKALLHSTAQDATNAREILNNPLFQRIYEEDMDMLFKGFLTLDPNDTDRMAQTVLSGKALLKLKEKFENVALMGAGAHEALEDYPTTE